MYHLGTFKHEISFVKLFKNEVSIKDYWRSIGKKNPNVKFEGLIWKSW